MTPTQFRREHGDPATWSPEEFEGYLEACDEVEAELNAATLVLVWSEPLPRRSAVLGPGERR
ncbi:hypothetical protein HW130_17300 [Streptomyces sp. PKU-EA00015]|uniref:hypothetical protein n=1 Tax=Streptomyces sp. PKU-EA00015 TaxID=2748326 RepID=UPI0015A45EA4|nr:hypothetical protein [Streptomyces sp. PKU-EA00015]NWF28001.1 hypothetical protein [Streptomyces sp. PKU-EA00015]